MVLKNYYVVFKESQDGGRRFQEAYSVWLKADNINVLRAKAIKRYGKYLVNPGMTSTREGKKAYLVVYEGTANGKNTFAYNKEEGYIRHNSHYGFFWEFYDQNMRVHRSSISPSGYLGKPIFGFIN